MERTAAPATLIRALAETAARVEAVGRQLSTAQLVASPAAGAWSPNEILWHIRATADVYGEQIVRILKEEQPRWRHVSPRARMKKVRYDEVPFADSVAVFARQRAELVALLESMELNAWERFALVRVDYKPDEDWRLTLQERVAGMVKHEQVHCTQMEQVAAALRESG